MYPEWPESEADLVPLPKCDGPKLKPFNFQGPQKFEFLEHLGEGLHSHVFKIEILGKVYALKLFRFCYDSDWMGPSDICNLKDRELVSTFYNYSEPFNCECRAFGRLQETGHEELALKCHGYMLLDREHEDKMMSQFRDLRLEFTGNMWCFNDEEDMRLRFLDKDGRAPPIRGIIKEFGQQDEENFQPALARKIFRDIIKLQKLGIFRIDVAARQIINGGFCDFSTAVTVPHFLTNPELNPHLNPWMIAAMEYETFQLSLSDYLDFNSMMDEWNWDFGGEKRRISVWAFTGPENGCQRKYTLRSDATGKPFPTLVDPRKYNWRDNTVNGASPGEERTKKRRITRNPKAGKNHGHRDVSSRTRRQLSARPQMWYYHTHDDEWAEEIRDLRRSPNCFLEWHYKGGFMFPAEYHWRSRKDLKALASKDGPLDGSNCEDGSEVAIRCSICSSQIVSI